MMNPNNNDPGFGQGHGFYGQQSYFPGSVNPGEQYHMEPGPSAGYPMEGGPYYEPPPPNLQAPPYPQHQAHSFDGYSENPYFEAPHGQSTGYIPETAGWNPPRQQEEMAGFFYERPSFSPQLFGSTVSAIAFDHAYAAIYVASTTQAMSAGRRSHRASMLATHSSLDGMLYSSVAGHPEAGPDTLQAVYKGIFGISTAIFSTRPRVPPHAYKPPYGSCRAAAGMVPDVPAVGGSAEAHLGINTLVPLHGSVASVSPSAVRVHTAGGLQLADRNIQGMVCGAAHPHQDQRMLTHLVVGGIASGSQNKHQIQCLDLWHDLRVVSSRMFRQRTVVVGVTAMASSPSTGSIVAGCSDGTIRVLDGSVQEVANVKSHAGGVASVAVSENLIATCGYGPRPTSFSDTDNLLYAFPDPTVLVYDIRYLGRGGISHSFAGMRGGPHFISFLPSVADQPTDRLLVASGQPAGGLQIIVPFEPPNDQSSSFLIPQLEAGESLSAMCVAEDDLALGTTSGRLLRYQMAGYTVTPKSNTAGPNLRGGVFVPSGTTPSSDGVSNIGAGGKHEKQPLEMPPFERPIPAFSIDISLIDRNDPDIRHGVSDNVRSICTAYTLCREPQLTRLGNPSSESLSSFGPLTTNTMVPPSHRNISNRIRQQGNVTEGDFLLTIPTSKLDLDLLENHHPRHKDKPSLSNPNKLLNSNKLFALCYDGVSSRKKNTNSYAARSASNSFDEDSATDNEVGVTPQRYRLTLSANFKIAGAFDYAEFNRTSLYPGWDYPPTNPNAFTPVVLYLLYFVPEVRSVVLAAQFEDSVLSTKATDKGLAAELGFLYHQIESLSRFAVSTPTKLNSGKKGLLGIWSPSNFISTLTTMPEAEQLQILDGCPAAVDAPRRPEAFYRFLLHHLDKELSRMSGERVMDALYGIDFISANEFVTGSGPLSKSSTRALTVDLFYQPFLNSRKKQPPRFGEVLQGALCRETRLRAWNQESKTYETIVQHKIATSLPKILSLSCGCAGMKEEDGLSVWRTDVGESDHWLPEYLEIELEEDKSVVVREKVADDQTENGVWKEYRSKSSFPPSLSTLLSSESVAGARKRRYRLDAVLSFVRGDADAGESESDGDSGHHVLHVRVPKQYRKRALQWQEEESLKLAAKVEDELVLTHNSDPQVFQRRAKHKRELLDSLGSSDASDEWILANGFVVSNTITEDARAFHVPFKEPCLIVFREVDEETANEETAKLEGEATGSSKHGQPIPPEVMLTRSISTGKLPDYGHPRSFSDLPGEGDIIAFDAEFVSVQEERRDASFRETRHALARISVLDCARQKVVIDDHVLPREPVVDYLTRFSGIVANDLDPKTSPHHLVSTRSAYLKLRYLMERKCIFLGHGLFRDFLTVNLVVPSHQIIDTVEIFHQDRMRKISLRFLANYVLGRDMQQDTHDSIEDARAAYELYRRAVEMKKEGTFDQFLNELYEHGQKTDWKLGVEDLSKA